jgi:hypothetical protein
MKASAMQSPSGVEEIGGGIEDVVLREVDKSVPAERRVPR